MNILKILLILLVLVFTGCNESVKKQSEEKTPVVNVKQQEETSKRFKLGAKYFKIGKYEHAISNYLEGLKITPDSALGYNLLGMAYRFKYQQSGKSDYLEKEIKAFRKSIELQPLFIPAVKNLAVTLLSTGQKKEAVIYLKKALELNPMDPERELLQKLILSVENRK